MKTIKLLCQEKSGTSAYTEKPSAMAVILKLEYTSDLSGGLLKQIPRHHPQSFWFSISEVRPGNMYSDRFRYCWCCLPRDPTQNFCSVCLLCGSYPLTEAVSPPDWLPPEAARNCPLKRGLQDQETGAVLWTAEIQVSCGWYLLSQSSHFTSHSFSL